MSDEDNNAQDTTEALETEKDIADQFYDDRDEVTGKSVPKEEAKEETGDADDAAEGDDKTDDSTTDDADAGNEDEDKKDDVVDNGEVKLEQDSLLDGEDVQRVSEYAKANDLSAEESKKVLDIADKAVSDYAKRYDEGAEDRNNKIVDDASAGWLRATRDDKEIGGDNLKQTAAFANRVIEQYGTPELKAALNDSGLGNHPELVRMLSRIGKAGADDTIKHNNNPPEEEEVSAADMFYRETYT